MSLGGANHGSPNRRETMQRIAVLSIPLLTIALPIPACSPPLDRSAVEPGPAGPVPLAEPIPGVLEAGVYERSTPHSPATIHFHGSLEERYIVEPSGNLCLQFKSGPSPSFEYTGRQVGTSPDAITLAFDDDDRWSAAARLEGACLVVDYNTLMDASDFEDGVYCRP